jgi:mannose-6-phosphate isomerase-like protein (cupin superfamily)
MLADGRTWTNPRTGASLTWRRDGADGVLERLMRPGTGKADAHVHLDYVERFEVLEGTATLELDGRTISAGPGETVEVPPGTPHRNPYNATDADLRLRHTASPGMESDTVNRQGEFSDLQLFVVLHGTRARSYRAGIPVALQKPVIALGAALGRRRGLRPGYE